MGLWICHLCIKFKTF